MAVGSMLAIRLFALFLVALAHGGQSALSSPSAHAWNGQLLPGAVPDVLNASPFLPYYVPDGECGTPRAYPRL